jgi:hypothetical protein
MEPLLPDSLESTSVWDSAMSILLTECLGNWEAGGMLSCMLSVEYVICLDEGDYPINR